MYARQKDPDCFVNMEGVGARIVALGTTTISASTATSRAVSPDGETLLVVSTLVSLCSRHPLNGALEVGDEAGGW